MKNDNRESFIFYRSFKDSINDLSDSDKLIIYEAITEYGLNHVEPKLKGFPKALFSLIKPQLDANFKRWKSGLKGGAPKGSRNNPNGRPKTNQSTTNNKPLSNHYLTNNKANVNDNDNDNDNVNDNKESTNVPKKDCLSLPSTPAKKYCDENLYRWLSDNAPYIKKNFTHLITTDELTKLKDKYETKNICSNILQIENRKDLRKRYSNLYMTLVNWLKNNDNGK